MQANSQKWGAKDEALSAALRKTQQEVHDALCDSFDTPKAVQVLSDLVSLTNTYMQQPVADVKEPLLK